MASINCPRCGSRLHHFSIDVIAGGGGLSGSGGIICPSCQNHIPNSEIARLARGFDSASDLLGRIAQRDASRSHQPRWLQSLTDVASIVGGAAAVLFMCIFLVYVITRSWRIAIVTVVVVGAAGVALLVWAMYGSQSWGRSSKPKRRLP